jgi:SAM-dependent methyltransferase
VSDDQLLGDQIDYYRARAPEYDRWFERKGRYDRGAAETIRWFEEVDQVRAVLASVPLDDADVLELAPGTGIWTEQLVRRVGRLTAVDAAPEMIQENRKRLGRRADLVTYVQADLFSWRPDRAYDAVVFCFWISHVPDARVDGFLAGVRSMLRPGGSVFFVDGRREPTSTAADHQLPGDGTEIMTRRLDDGREFRIVKRFRSALDLEHRCRRAGLAVRVSETPTYFQYGLGSTRPAVGATAARGRSTE